MSMLDDSTLGDFFNLIYRQGQTFTEHEIAHSINNHLSVLSMQINMMSRGLAQGDAEIVQRKIAEITETAKRIQSFARTLSDPGENSANLSSIDLDAVVRETLGFIRVLPALANVQVEYANPDHAIIVNCDAEGIKLVLISFLYSARQVVEHPLVHLSIDEKMVPRDAVQLVCELLNEPSAGESLKYPLENSHHPGAAPMRQLKRILESESNNLQLTLMDGDCLRLICTIAEKGARPES